MSEYLQTYHREHDDNVEVEYVSYAESEAEDQREDPEPVHSDKVSAIGFLLPEYSEPAF